MVLGLSGGRLDHGLLNLVVLADPKWKTASVRALAGDCLVTVVHDHGVVRGPAGSTVSLVAIGAPAILSTEGLQYPLENESLRPTSARGLSNVMSADRAEIAVHDGVVLVLQPGAGDRW